MGLNWKRFERNFNELIQLDLKGLEVGFQTSLSNLSISGLPEFVRWCDTLQLQYKKPVMIKPNIVNDPIIMGLQMLPSRYTKYIDQAINLMKDMDRYPVNDSYATWSHYGAFLKTVKAGIKNNRVDSERGNFSQLKKFLNSLDKKRNMRFLEVFPEMTDFWGLLQNVDG